MKKRKDGKRNTKPKKKEKSQWCSQDEWFKAGEMPTHLPDSPFKTIRNKEVKEIEEKNPRKSFRCPKCNKRLKPKAIFADNAHGEFLTWGIPKHKEK